MLFSWEDKFYLLVLLLQSGDTLLYCDQVQLSRANFKASKGSFGEIR